MKFVYSYSIVFFSVNAYIKQKLKLLKPNVLKIDFEVRCNFN